MPTQRQINDVTESDRLRRKRMHAPINNTMAIGKVRLDSEFVVCKAIAGGLTAVQSKTLTCLRARVVSVGRSL
jgi:hypothetical protein